MGAVYEALRSVDLVLHMVDASQSFGKGEKYVLDLVRRIRPTFDPVAQQGRPYQQGAVASGDGLLLPAPQLSGNHSHLGSQGGQSGRPAGPDRRKPPGTGVRVSRRVPDGPAGAVPGGRAHSGEGAGLHPAGASLFHRRRGGGVRRRTAVRRPGGGSGPPSWWRSRVRRRSSSAGRAA